MSVSAARYDQAITIADTSSESYVLANISVLLCSCSAVLTFILLNIIIYFIDNFFINIVLYVLPLSIFVAGLNTVFVNINLRRQRQKNIAYGRVLQATSSSAAQIIFGFAKIGVYGLIAGQIIGLIFSFSRLLDLRILNSIFKSKTKKQRNIILAKYIKFPKFDALSAMVSVFNNHLPVIIIALFSTASNVGAYALAQRVIITPLNIVANSIASTILAFSRIKFENKNQIMMSGVNAIGNIVIFVVTLTGVVLIYFFESIFGYEWKQAGVIAGWVCLTAGAKFKTDAMFSLTTINNKLQEGLGLQIRLMMQRSVLLIILLKITNIEIAIMIFSILSSLIYNIEVNRIVKSIDLATVPFDYQFYCNLFFAAILIYCASSQSNIYVAISFVFYILVELLTFFRSYAAIKKLL